jgi:hypothetical protein
MPAAVRSALPAVSIVIVITGWLLSLSPDRLVLFFPDDAFFYLKIADHIRQGLGSTFDGLNPTNGYHPLYMVMLAGLSFITPLQGYAGLRAAFVFDTVLFLAFLVCVAAVARRLGFSRTWTITIPIACVPLAFVADYGMETNLVLLAAWALLLVATTLGDTRQTALFGTIGALLVLSRLDAVLLLGAVTVGVLWSQRHRPIRALAVDAAVMIAPAVLALACFAVWNIYAYGSSSPVSSVLKAGSPEIGRFLQNALVEMPHSAMFVFIGSFSISAVTLTHAMRHQTPRNILLGGVALWHVGYVLILLLSLRGAMAEWYYALPLSFVPLMSSALAADFLQRPRLSRLLAAGIVIAGVSLTLVEVRYWLSRWWFFEDVHHMGEWISSELPLSARFYQVDHSGIVGYFSQRPVINGDGLVNSWAYQDVLRDKTIPQYLKAHGVEYIVWNGYDGEATIEIEVPRWRLPPLSLRVDAPKHVVRFGPILLLRIDPSQLVVADLDCKRRIRRPC